MKTSTIDFILELHNHLNEDWKRKLESKFTKIFTKAKLGIGAWVYWSGNDPGYGTIRGKCHVYVDAYDVSFLGNPNEKTTCSRENLRKLSTNEIGEVLAKEELNKTIID